MHGSGRTTAAKFAKKKNPQRTLTNEKGKVDTHMSTRTHIQKRPFVSGLTHSEMKLNVYTHTQMYARGLKQHKHTQKAHTHTLKARTHTHTNAAAKHKNIRNQTCICLSVALLHVHCNKNA